MRWIASCVASLAVAVCLSGATALARPISPVGPVRATAANQTQATQASKGHRPSKHAPRPSGTKPNVLLGHSAIEPGVASAPAGRPDTFRFTGRRSGSVYSIYVYIDAHNRATRLIAGLYSNKKGLPGSLLTAGVLNHPKAHAWNRLRVGSASVQAGHVYWLAVLGRGGRLYFRAGRNGPCSTRLARQTRLRSLRSSWSGDHHSSLCPISAYAVRQPNTGIVNTVLSPVGGGASNGGATPSVPLLHCDLNATPPSLVSQVAAASPGQVVCLASGDYSGFAGTSKSAPGVTITSAPGAVVTFDSGIRLNLSSVQNFTLDGTGGGGTMTVGGEVDMETGSDALQNKALNLTFQNINFAAGGNVLIKGPENSNITFNRDTFVDGNSNGGCTSLGAQFYLLYGTSPNTTPSGVTIQNSVFVAPGDLWNPNRAIQTMSPMAVENNVIVGFLDRVNSCNHIDSFFLYSGSPGTTGGNTFTGNLCYDDYNCMAAFDGTQQNTVTDNACFEMERGCIVLYSDVGSVVSHNTAMTGGADPSGCATQPNTQACTAGTVFENSHKTGDPVGSGETFTNNVSGSAPNIGDPGAITTNTHNMWSSATSPNIRGTATFAGGAHPTTWAGLELTSGSAGHTAGSDGLDVGIRASAGGPPTGGGSAPVNTVAPSLTGAPIQGQTLTNTGGTWTITGNIPTATTYMWWDCPTNNFSPGNCTPIQPQTAPASTNDSTYTLQPSDAGKYIFSQVTTTNANGQINATSNGVGPVA